MKIILDCKVMGSRATAALLSAAKLEVVFKREFTKTGQPKDVYFISGNKFKNMGEVGRHVLLEVNSWMLDAGLVDVSQLTDVKHTSGELYFIIEN